MVNFRNEVGPTSPQSHSPCCPAKFTLDALSNSSEQSPDVTSSSSSTNLAKTSTKTENNLGMLIAFNNKFSDRGSVTRSSGQSKIELPVEEKKAPQQQTKKRFQNIRNGLIKSNRNKMTKPEVVVTESDHPEPSKTSHLQLIVSKCRCEFYMIDFEDKIGDEEDQAVLVKSLPALSNSPGPQISLPNTTLNYSQIFPSLNRTPKTS